MAVLKNNYAEFMEVDGGRVVVNPLQVALLRKASNGTQIVFAGGECVLVANDMRSVEKDLFSS